MSEPLAHLYALALRTIDEQERRADALRARLGPVLAAAALGASLLGAPASGVVHLASVGEALTTTATLGGLAAALAAAFRVLVAKRRLGVEVDPSGLAAELERDGIAHDEQRFYALMIARLGDQRTHNDSVFDRLSASFTAMLVGITVMLCGLALAAIVGSST